MNKKKRRVPKIVWILLFIVVGAPLILVGVSFIGRITPESVIPDSFEIYASVPNPLRMASKVLSHEPLADIMALAELAPLQPLLSQVSASGLADNTFVRWIARGRLSAAMLSEGRILAAWDTGMLSPLLRALPLISWLINVEDLYYVRAGNLSRFEFRLKDGGVFFIGPYKNLLIISNNMPLFESVLNGTGTSGYMQVAGAKSFQSSNYDAVFLLSQAFLMDALRGSDVPDAVKLLNFPGPVEASLEVLPKQLKLNVVSALGSGNEAIQGIIQRDSQAASLASMIPDNAQYMTLLSAGELSMLLNVVSAIKPGGVDWAGTIRTADSGARMALGMNLEELLFSWTGAQFAVFGLEGRPNPVIAIEIRDDKKRREVFERAFRSIVLNENVQLNLDGNRIPRIQVPDFLAAFLRFMKVDIPSPYYTAQNGYLFISESAETLLAAVNSIRRNEVLTRTDLWRTLSENNPGPSSFSVFYSIDPLIENSIPFFLKGSSEVSAVLRLYRQGLARVNIANEVLTVSLEVIPGAGGGIVPVVGYPLDFSDHGRAGNSVYQVSHENISKLLFTSGSGVVTVNPLDRIVKEMPESGAVFYAIPAAGSGASAGVIWIVDSRGNVNLTNIEMESVRGFPLSTGIRLSAAPTAAWGKLFLCDEDGSIYTVDSSASVNRWGASFAEALRSPPAFLDFRNRSYAAIYLKSFLFGAIYLHDANGNAIQNWPVSVTDIAFGSPLVFSGRQGNSAERLLVAFITQAGRLTVYTENAQVLAPFPLDLEGVFYVQPVFDGECLWIIESGGTLYRVSLDGEVLSQNIPRLSVRESGFITAADITGGRRSEALPKEAVFFAGEGNALYGYSRNFNSLDGFPLPVWGRPLIGDIQGGGKIEVAGMGMDNKLYLWQFR